MMRVEESEVHECAEFGRPKSTTVKNIKTSLPMRLAEILLDGYVFRNFHVYVEHERLTICNKYFKISSKKLRRAYTIYKFMSAFFLSTAQTVRNNFTRKLFIVFNYSPTAYLV